MKDIITSDFGAILTVFVSIITIIEKLYLSFPQFVDKGYKISGKCNEIWGNEQNYFGYQKDKQKYQLNTNGRSEGKTFPS